MPSFHTQIGITSIRGALELLGIAGDEDRDADTLDAESEETYEVEVTYEPGWFQPGRLSGPPENCYPDEGEDPEITAIVHVDENEVATDLIEHIDYDSDLMSDLIRQAWDDQASQDAEQMEAAAEAAYDDWVDRDFGDY